MKHLKRPLALLLSFTLLLGLLSFAGAVYDYQGPKVEKNIRLSFDDSGKLRILQLADIQDTKKLRFRAKMLLWAVIKKTDPDLLMLTGDNIDCYAIHDKEEAAEAIRSVMKFLNRFGIPIAAVFGNHDDMNLAMTKQEQMDLYESYSNFIGFRGVVAEKTVDETRVNVGTYRLPVYETKDSDRSPFGIWCFDSGNYNPDTNAGGYGYVYPEQIEWYKETSDKLKEENGGVPVPSVVFQHIAPPQVFKAFKEVPLGTEGSVEENCFDYNADGSVEKVRRAFVLPDGLDSATNWLRERPSTPALYVKAAYEELDAMIAQGDVMAVIFGHDHLNNYIVSYEGIDLVCTEACTYQAYRDGNQGFRLITIDKSDLSSYGSQTLLWDEVLRSFPLLYIIERIARFFDDFDWKDLFQGGNA